MAHGLFSDTPKAAADRARPITQTIVQGLADCSAPTCSSPTSPTPPAYRYCKLSWRTYAARFFDVASSKRNCEPATYSGLNSMLSQFRPSDSAT